MARNEKAISNEEIIAAILQHGTIRKAAEAAGTTPRTIYDRMKRDPSFRADYREVKNDILRNAVYNINSKLSEAIDTISDIMNDTEVNPAVRLQAAQTILNSVEKFTARLVKDEAQGRIESQFDKYG